MSALGRTLEYVDRRRGVTVRLADGSALLSRRIWARLSAWVAAGRRDDLEGWKAAAGPVLRLVVLGVVAWLAYRLLRAVPWLMWALAAGWCWAAFAVTRKPSADASDEESEAPDAGPVHALLWELIGDRSGVHLNTVLAHLRERGHGEDWGVPELRARLAALRVPVRRSVKVAGRVTWGVRAADLPAPSPLAPAEVDQTSST